MKKVKDILEWGVLEWKALLQEKEFTDDDDGARRVIADVVFSHEDDVYYARYLVKGEKGMKKSRDFASIDTATITIEVDAMQKCSFL